MKTKNILLAGVGGALPIYCGWGRVRPDMRSGSERFWVLTGAPLGTRDGLLNWLGNGCGEDMSERIKPIECGEPDRVRIEIDWDSPTGILVADPRLSRVESSDDTSFSSGPVFLARNAR